MLFLVTMVEVTAVTLISSDSGHHILLLFSTSFNQLGIIFLHNKISDKNMFQLKNKDHGTIQRVHEKNSLYCSNSFIVKESCPNFASNIKGTLMQS